MDIGHQVGHDLSLDASGGIATAADDTWTRQRILRRLFTNPGGYVWDLSYGGGLRRMIGEPVVAAGIMATIRTQIALESAVAATPAPQISVTTSAGGVVGATISYADASTAQTATLGVSLGQQA